MASEEIEAFAEIVVEMGTEASAASEACVVFQGIVAFGRERQEAEQVATFVRARLAGSSTGVTAVAGKSESSR